MSRRGEGAKTKPQEHKLLDSDYQLALVFSDFPEDSDILTNPLHPPLTSVTFPGNKLQLEVIF